MKRHTGLGHIRRIHFIGIGGISMSGLAEILSKDGFTVSGSDWTSKDTTDHLQNIGIDISIGRGDASIITPDIDLVVYTAAVKPDNPELMAAKALGIPTMVRAELLGVMLQGYEHAVCVAGSHGKTSTTALITSIAVAAGLDPTVNIGGHIAGTSISAEANSLVPQQDNEPAPVSKDTNYLVGDSSYFILESCEYSNSYHHFHPYIGIILNIDADHMEFHGTMDALIDSFAKFARNIRPGGTLIIQENIPGFERIVSGLSCNVITFCTSKTRDDSLAHEQNRAPSPAQQYWIRDATQNADGSSSFDIMTGSLFMARVKLPLPGKYNMYNALAAFIVGIELGIEAHAISKALYQAQNVRRRYEYKGEINGITIIDDYAHHPTAIKACLKATREAYPGKRLICLFQPHTYTRTRNHFDDFAMAFGDADITLFAPIYAAREPFDPTISSAMLAQKVKENGHASINCNNLDEAEAWLRGKLMPHDLLITMGAGDAHLVGERLLAK